MRQEMGLNEMKNYVGRFFLENVEIKENVGTN